MTYEYERTQGGLGWAGKWTRPGTTGTGIQQNQSCQVPGIGTAGRIICGRRDEEQFLTNQTCRPVNWMGETNCQTFPAGQMGTYWCCPPGRPGTGAPAGPVEQLPMSRQDIGELQSYINAQPGCSAGTVDQVWGPNTQRGAECVAQRDGWASLTGRFPFLSTLMATPTGQIREPMVFDPGTGYAKPGDPGTTKTPEQAGVARVQTTLQPGEQAPAELQQAPGFFARTFRALPWWGWMGIAGGVGLLTVLGVAIYQAGEEEAEAEAEWDLDLVRAGL